jgi:P-type Cu2+ transporter
MTTANLPTTTPAPLPKALVNIEGMRCAGCVAAVEKHLLATPGVVSASVNLLTAMAVVEHQPELAPIDIIQRLADKGFSSRLRDLQEVVIPSQSEASQPVNQLIIALVLLALSIAGHIGQATTLPHHQHGNTLASVWWHLSLATVSLLGPGRFILVDGWQSLRNGHPNMNSLVGMGVSTAYFTSVLALIFPQLMWECFFDEPVMLVGAMLLGRSLEAYARKSAAKDFDRLLALQPPTAHLLVGDQLIEVPVSQLQVGDWIKVLPGETVPADGHIRQGSSGIDESLLTGESQPVSRQVGDAVTAGTNNHTAALDITVDRVGTETLLSRMVEVITNAQARKVPLQQLADSVAGYFAYFVMGLAFLTVSGWYLVSHWLAIEMPLITSLKMGIAVLAIACPCALGLATPTAILVGTGIGAQRGLLIKGGDVLEKLRTIKTVVFDKTGTLTVGKPKVTQVQLLLPESEVWPLAAMAAAGTNHPVAKAVLAHATSLGYAAEQSIDSETVPGLGTVARSASGHKVLLGSALWLQEQGIKVVEEDPHPLTPLLLCFHGRETRPEQSASLKTEEGDPEHKAKSLVPSPFLEKSWGEGLSTYPSLNSGSKELRQDVTLVYVSIDSQLAGVIGLVDPLRADAVDTVSSLQQQGLEVVLLTGDRPIVAHKIAAELGITKVFADIRPTQKAEILAELQKNGAVAMVGDGLNDAPALAVADVGMAIGDGTGVAIDTADVVLMADKLAGVKTAINLGKATGRKIRQNLFWAVVYNCLGIPVAAGLLYPWHLTLDPAAAGACMAMSSVSVVLNSIGLRWTFHK